MAVIDVTYCNASRGQGIDGTYDDVAHSITFIGFDIACPDFGVAGGAPAKNAGDIIYQHDDGTTQWTVVVQNTAPFYNVLSAPLPVCSVSITSVTPTNSATDTSNDGQILVVATGSGALTYSLDGGPYQVSGLFTNVAPGLHTIFVRNYWGKFKLECFANTTVTVGFTTISCDLALGQITQTSSPGATITVVSYTTSHPLPVEYRLDSGAWQTSNVFTGLAAGTYNVQIRFKNYTSCTANRNVVISAAAPCTAIVNSVLVTNEQTRYGNNGSLQILASTSNGPLQYSINGGSTYQSSSSFLQLHPGTYNIRVKDALNCTADAVAVVQAYKSIVLDFPIAGGIRVVNTAGALAQGLPNFDNTLLANMHLVNIEPCTYYQKFLTGDVLTYQYRSSFSFNAVQLYTKAGVLTASFTPIKKSSNVNHVDIRTANFSDAGAGKTQIWFNSEIPSFYEVGLDIVVSGLAGLNGTYTIEDIKPGTLNAIGNIVLIISKVYPGGGDPLSATVTTTYNLHDYEVYEIQINWALYAANQYYLKFTGSDVSFAPYVALSEPIETSTTLIDHILIKWSNIDNAFKIDYSTGIVNFVRVEGRLLLQPAGGESEVMEDSNRRLIKLRENVTRLVSMDVYDVPPYLAEKLRVAMAHDTILVEGVNYQTEDKLNFTNYEMYALVDLSVKLRQVDFIAENSDDSSAPADGAAVLGVNGGLLLVQP